MYVVTDFLDCPLGQTKEQLQDLRGEFEERCLILNLIFNCMYVLIISKLDSCKQYTESLLIIKRFHWAT